LTDLSLGPDEESHTMTTLWSAPSLPARLSFLRSMCDMDLGHEPATSTSAFVKLFASLTAIGLPVAN
jgi:hypothetical protein